MASASWHQGNKSAPTVTLTVTQQSQSIAGNYSTVAWSLVISRPSSVNSSANKAYSVTVNGTTVSSGNTTIGGSGSKTIASGTSTVYHNSDGTKSISFSFSLYLGLDWGGTWLGTASGSGTLTLTTIPRASQPTLRNYEDTQTINTGYFGNKIIIKTNTASQAFKHKAYYSIGAGSWKQLIDEEPAQGSGGMYWTNYAVWTIQNELMNAIPNSTYGTVNIHLETYSDATFKTKIGDEWTTLTGYVRDSIVPTISNIALSEAASGIPSGAGFVQSQSKLKAVITAAGAYSSKINSCVVNADNVNYSGLDITSNILTTSGTKTVTVTVTDSRGRTATKTQTITVNAYSPPRINTLTATRCNQDGTPNEQGEFAKVSYNAEITALNNTNAKTFSIKYKKTSQTTYTTQTISATSYKANGNIIIPAESGSSYTIRFDAEDSFYSGDNAIKKEIPLSTAETIFNVRANGKGLAFFKVSEKDAIEFDDPIYIDGVLFGIETATIGEWTYHKWADGRLEIEGNIEISNLPCTTALGGWFRTDVQFPSNYPVSFVGDVPKVNMSFSTGAGTGALIWETTATTLTVAPSFYLIRPTSSNSISGILSIIAKGRWKL